MGKMGVSCLRIDRQDLLLGGSAGSGGRFPPGQVHGQEPFLTGLDLHVQELGLSRSGQEGLETQ